VLVDFPEPFIALMQIIVLMHFIVPVSVIVLILILVLILLSSSRWFVAVYFSAQCAPERRRTSPPTISRVSE
jgi:hypothetical protein